MNERIKLFEKQCWNYQSNCVDTEKFAELIVKECAEQIVSKGTDWVDFAPSQIGVRPEYWDMAQQIKQHFGVEEGVYMHPLHTPEKVRRIWNNDDTLNRGTGRSTILALQYITMALANPGTEFKIVDHHPTHKAALYLRETIQAMVGRLGFKHFIFKETSIQFGE